MSKHWKKMNRLWNHQLHKSSSNITGSFRSSMTKPKLQFQAERRKLQRKWKSTKLRENSIFLRTIWERRHNQYNNKVCLSPISHQLGRCNFRVGRRWSNDFSSNRWFVECRKIFRRMTVRRRLFVECTVRRRFFVERYFVEKRFVESY